MESDDRLFLADWMGFLAPLLAPRRLVDALLPGSHDSNTFTIVSPAVAAPFACCQKLSVAEQLLAGCRFIDLRYGPGPDDRLVDQHGPLSGGDFFAHVEQLRDFCAAHPLELVVLNLQSEKRVGAAAKQFAIHKLTQTLGELLLTFADLSSWFRLPTATFGELWKSPRRVLMITTDHLMADSGLSYEACARLGLHHQDCFATSRWHDVNHVQQLLDANLEFARGRPRDKLCVAQLVLTPERDTSAVIKNLLLFRLPTISNLVDRLRDEDRLQLFLAEHARKTFNVVVFDYVDRYPELLLFLAACNAPLPLKIHKAFVGSREVTDELAELAPPLNPFYLPSTEPLFRKHAPRFDLLTVFYSVGDSPVLVKQATREARHLLLHWNKALLARINPATTVVLIFFFPEETKFKTLGHMPTPDDVKEIEELKKKGLLFVVCAHQDNLLVL